MSHKQRVRTDLGRSTSYNFAELDLLTRDQEIELARSRDNGDQTAVSTLVEHNMRLVESVVLRYISRKSPDFEDLVQEGAIGLISAAKKYDHRRGYRFSTYATYGIQREIIKAIRRKLPSIRIPSRRQSEIVRCASVCNKLNLDLTPNNIVKATDLDYETAMQIWQDYLLVSPKSLDNPLTTDGQLTLLDMLDGTPNNDRQQSINTRIDLTLMIEQALSKLGERSRYVIRLHYLSGNCVSSLDEVGAILGITGERVRQIEQKALRKLYDLLAPNATDFFT